MLASLNILYRFLPLCRELSRSKQRRKAALSVYTNLTAIPTYPLSLVGEKPDVLRPGIVGMRGYIRLRPSMTIEYTPLSTSSCHTRCT